ncbi:MULTISPECIES: GNAT family N-acetyltransferase [Pontibacillus]|uniref:GNAT family protein n=1 Tax=Pontibacillus chungwhensis TaxID=265426 RepID=A0ABY8V1I7_9BACI|nr:MULTISPECIES: GNAT family protein [Pontibacillus]MCD5325497.1 GNAT family N-acetyltransferase [Pontibacillus sp. HN14]WIF98609.1 GNAT family protein [Pontibacillus chungwhensis]
MFIYQINKELHLKLLDVTDIDRLFRLVNSNRRHLRKWLPWVDVTEKPEDTKRFIESTMQKFADNKGFETGIYYKGELAGVIGVHELDHQNKKTSIGYWLGENFQGKGIVTKAATTYLHYLFETRGFNRVEIRCAKRNKKSQAIPERLGFTKEGTIRQCEWVNDRYVDHVVYSLLKEEYKLMQS